ncbi:hypothetical protein [Cystobacter ferrugineus]|uniref:Uncharacterized protein n=1 Tax=Cystobacter ferrugineus TaxID=83449 RepID=A0A1L9BHZ1_9BACT|nr:hypothetical protein [Cystobacter ferrugineus]OJH41914.1 hypothetical protein BON30_01390 [Cystobacter ferrugineus]
MVIRWDPGEPTHSRKAEPPPDPARVDPWSVDAEQLARESRVVTVCLGCQGEKRRSCSDCAGSARRTCRGCSGSGRVPGVKGGMKNCPTCRARGDVKCTACKSGKIDCVTCGADGRVDAWLEVETQLLTQVQSHPANRSSALHEKLTHPEDFDAPPRATCLKDKDFPCVDEELGSPAAARAPAGELASVRAAHVAALKAARDEALARVAATQELEAQRQALEEVLGWSRRLLKAGEGTEAALTGLAQRLAGVEARIAAAKKRAEELAAREQALRERQEQVEAASFSGSGYSGGGRVHVRGYYRKNGTYVSPHTRSRRR